MITENVHLREIAYARSGDKGSNANIGIIAYCPEGYEFLKKHLTADVVNDFFRHLEVEETVRYELPNLGALNFVLKGVLAGGASCSLRIDAQGKALGQALLEMEMQVPEKVLCHCRRQK
ncbi:MAG: hypothetical protein K940chlam7_01385 [Chlamydiae bacterium]|nr:hypothetical protein [Chlamydiota bacterium]